MGYGAAPGTNLQCLSLVRPLADSYARFRSLSDAADEFRGGTAWEASLQQLEAVRRQHEDAARHSRVVLTAEDRARVREMARDLPSVWCAPTTTPADRKAMLRIVIEAVTIRPVDVSSYHSPPAPD